MQKSKQTFGRQKPPPWSPPDVTHRVRQVDLREHRSVVGVQVAAGREREEVLNAGHQPAQQRPLQGGRRVGLAGRGGDRQGVCGGGVVRAVMANGWERWRVKPAPKK